MRLGTDLTTPARWVLLTGATGFVGQALLAELLARGHRVLCVVRSASPGEARNRLTEALAPWGSDAERALESGRLAVMRGDLHRPGLALDSAIRQHLSGQVASVIHAAGSTLFRARGDGEPDRTNVAGTREVMRLAADCGCRDWHFISTAYVCGRCTVALESLSATPPPFHNDYERGKWQAEQESAHAAVEAGAVLTIYRPSIVVGQSRTGMATRFAGIYYLFRATALLARSVEPAGTIDRHHIPLLIRAEPDGGTNLICIDDLAAWFGDLFDTPAARGGVYHLTHDRPPTNAVIKRVLEKSYDIGGGRFVSRAATPPPRSDFVLQAIFDDLTEPLASYLFDTPVFDCTESACFTARRPAPWTDGRLEALVRYAESVNWRPGGRSDPVDPTTGSCAPYFECFLPAHLPGATVAGLRTLDVDIRFVIEDDPDGPWWCRFRNGRLEDVRRDEVAPAEVTYRTRRSAFWQAVADADAGRHAFLTGEAQIEGNVERGLKFAAILHEFVRQCPCDRRTLEEYEFAAR